MKQTISKQLFYLGFILFLAHFLLLAAHQMSPNKITNYYLSPFFHQNYNMFVPPPDTQYHLFVFEGNKFIEDVFDNIVSKHQNNRLAGYEPFVIALSNSIFYFEKEALSNDFTQGKVQLNGSFMIIEKLVKNCLKSTKKLDLKNLKLVLLVNPINSKKQRVYYN